jgi:hypothetical protein
MPGDGEFGAALVLGDGSAGDDGLAVKSLDGVLFPFFGKFGWDDDGEWGLGFVEDEFPRFAWGFGASAGGGDFAYDVDFLADFFCGAVGGDGFFLVEGAGEGGGDLGKEEEGEDLSGFHGLFCLFIALARAFLWEAGARAWG